MTEALLELKAVDCGVLDPVDLSVQGGECVGISGPSGSGKTRLLRAVADLDPHGGECYLDGGACSARPAHDWRRRVSLLTADSRWWADTVAEHFPETDAAALAALDLAPGVMEAEVARLSTGQRQRLALVRLLVRQPRVLLLDEPTANLDADNQARVEELVGNRQAAHGLAVVWVSHDPRQLQRVAQHCYRIQDRRLVAEAPA